MESTVERVQTGDSVESFVVDEMVLEGLWSERPDVMEADVGTESYDPFVTSWSVTLGLLVDRVTSIGVYDTGRLLGLLVDEDETTIEWAEETFEAYRGSAEVVRTRRTLGWLGDSRPIPWRDIDPPGRSLRSRSPIR